MIHYYNRKGGELVEQEKLNRGCWINITPPFNYEELEQIATELDIPLDFLTDSLDIDERSRYELEDDVLLLVVNTPIINTNDDESAPLYITVPIGIIILPDFILTITSYENPVLQRFVEQKIRNFDPADRSNFVLLLFEQNVIRFLSCLKDLNVRRNAIEQELYDSSRNKELLKLLSIEKSFVYFVTSLSANALLMMKIQRLDLLGIKHDENKTDMLEAAIIDINQAQEMANIYSNILSGTMDTFASIISNNLNQVMQRLTLITIVLMVPTLVASFYGMNVSLPMSDWPYAFWAIITFAFLFSISLVYIFRRNKML